MSRYRVSLHLVFVFTDCNIDVVFVLDKSGSIGDGWKDILNFLISSANMIGQRSSNSHVGLVVFNDRLVYVRYSSL